MATPFNPYHEWLGLPPELTRPNYYELLGITTREADHQKIGLVADAAIRRLRTVEPGSRRRLHQQLLEKLENAKACLIDPQRRASYDRKLRGIIEPAQRTLGPPGAAAEKPDEAELELPQPLIPPLALARGKTDPMAPVELPPSLREADRVAEDPLSRTAPPDRDTPTPRLPTVVPEVPLAARSSVTRLVKARKKSSNYTVALTILASLSLMAMLALVWFLLRTNRDASPVADAGPAVRTPAEPQERPQKRTTRSGLVSSQRPQQQKAVPPTTAIAETKTNDSAVAESRAVDPDLPQPVLNDTAPEQKMTPLEPAAVPVTPPTDEELAELNQRLAAARDALGAQDFEKADTELSAAESLARLPEHQAQWKRLRLLTELAREFRQVLETALQGFQAGETILVGSTEVSIVESSASSITVRFAGLNRQYKIDQLPPGLALAIVDYAVSPDAPRTKAMKAAYATLQQEASEELLTKAQTWLQEAAAQDSTFQVLSP